MAEEKISQEVDRERPQLAGPAMPRPVPGARAQGGWQGEDVCIGQKWLPHMVSGQ